MDNIRSGNLSVTKMKQEILTSITILEMGPMHKRAVRQLDDGARFLRMIKRYPYNNCKTVSGLKKAISEEREKLKETLASTEKYTPNYQLSLFEEYEEVEERKLQAIYAERERLKAEIHWLHKCLGICSNRNYFS